MMDFTGNWKCQKENVKISVHGSHIYGHQNCAWVGIVQACGLQIFTLWDNEGNHFSDSNLNLTERIDANLDPRVQRT